MLNYRLHIIILGILLFFPAFPAASQEIDGTIARVRIIEGDTLFEIDLPPVNIIGPRVFESRREERKYNRLVRHVKVAYPYAKLAGIKFREYARKLEEIECEKEKGLLMKQVEEELLEEFEDDLRKLTFTQGLILIKLIDRETQHTSYEILREFRGMFRAVFWQSLGRIFGYDLRTEYNPYEDEQDKTIEHIVVLIEMGVI